MLTGRSCGGICAMSLPSSRMRPSSGVSKPASIRSSVVLPQPLGPSSAKNSPARMSSDKPVHGAEDAEFLHHRVDAQQRRVGRGFRFGFWFGFWRIRVHCGFRCFLGHDASLPHRCRKLAAEQSWLNRDAVDDRIIVGPSCDRRHERGQRVTIRRPHGQAELRAPPQNVVRKTRPFRVPSDSALPHPSVPARRPVRDRPGSLASPEHRMQGASHRPRPGAAPDRSVRNFQRSRARSTSVSNCSCGKSPPGSAASAVQRGDIG